MIEMTLPAMSCGHCVSTVTKTVQRIDPGATVEIDLASKRVRIESSHAAADFIPALVDEGYPPQPAAA